MNTKYQGAKEIPYVKIPIFLNIFPKKNMFFHEIIYFNFFEKKNQHLDIFIYS